MAGRIGAAAIVAWLVGALFACDDLRQDVLDCEEAVAVLEHCCGVPGTNFSCVYSSGCGTTYPDISIPESQCIRSESCETLVATGVCSRAQQAHATETAEDDAGGLCP